LGCKAFRPPGWFIAPQKLASNDDLSIPPETKFKKQSVKIRVIRVERLLMGTSKRPEDPPPAFAD
jgi:hypothetical protein